MKAVGSRLDREALNAARGTSKLSRNSGSQYFEFVQRLNGGSRLVESGSAVGSLSTHPIQNHFGSQILPSAQLRFENARVPVVAICSRTRSSRRQEHERFW